MNRELPDVQAGFRKGRGTRGKIANIHWIIEEAREFQKNVYFCIIDYAKAFDYESQQTVENLYQITLPTSREICMQVKKQELEQDMEERTGSKSGKEHVKSVYCHSAYLTYMQCMSGKCWAEWSTIWNQGCLEKYQ